MKSSVLGILAWGLLAGAAMGEPRPVVVELFTSQGCSSCPPADALIVELSPRDDVIALALHVDYWDYIGWKDTFGDPKYSQRQKNYARVAGESTVFTPQIVVDGREHIVGYQPMKLAEVINDSRREDSEVSLEITRQGNTVLVEAEAPARFSRPAEIHLVRYLPSQVVKIGRGENAGQAIEYANVVTSWDIAGKWDGRRPLQLNVDATGDLPIVVMIQLEGPRKVLAAARLR
ncbi:MAG: DUF1223 domain-containing protein [Paracoccaceae bacterium]|nr:DUF1223 domain-containing protein [Paracoccaceae bacterium]